MNDSKTVTCLHLSCVCVCVAHLKLSNESLFLQCSRVFYCISSQTQFVSWGFSGQIFDSKFVEICSLSHTEGVFQLYKVLFNKGRIEQQVVWFSRSVERNISQTAYEAVDLLQRLRVRWGEMKPKTPGWEELENSCFQQTINLLTCAERRTYWSAGWRFSVSFWVFFFFGDSFFLFTCAHSVFSASLSQKCTHTKFPYFFPLSYTYWLQMLNSAMNFLRSVIESWWLD